MLLHQLNLPKNYKKTLCSILGLYFTKLCFLNLAYRSRFVYLFILVTKANVKFQVSGEVGQCYNAVKASQNMACGRVDVEG